MSSNIMWREKKDPVKSQKTFGLESVGLAGFVWGGESVGGVGGAASNSCTRASHVSMRCVYEILVFISHWAFEVCVKFAVCAGTVILSPAVACSARTRSLARSLSR